MEQNATPTATSITRAYITATEKLGTNAIAKVTLDTLTGGNSFLKYAYVDLLDFVAIDNFNLNARIGVQPTYWSNWVDSFLGLRVVSASMLSSSYADPTADIGLGLMGAINVEYLPSVNYLVTGLNGNGLNPENDRAKDLAGRLDAEVLPGVTVGLGAKVENIGQSVGTTDLRKLLNVLVGYKADMGKVYGEVAYGKNTMGLSAAGLLNLGAFDEMMNPYGLFARVDIYDPNRGVGSDSVTSIFVGGTYNWNSNVKLVADYDSTTQNSTTTSQVSLRTEILF
ncbi:hypothetical protein A2526_04290 [candidate division WOR-1 bacterium RIFOXYD2_FULL_36_8]|nr:MAG: hypothetical protein A2526_04290 [candidate division WOR-1 bacterium RIFOXYD2_FULL_36_8]